MKVRLLKTHTHAGATYSADAELLVSDSVGAWLIEHDIAQALPEKASTKPQKTQGARP